MKIHYTSLIASMGETSQGGFSLLARHSVSKPVLAGAKRLNQNPIQPFAVEQGAMEAGRVKHFSVLNLSVSERNKVEIRFWLKVEKTDRCWLWKGWKHESGYGRFVIHGNNTYPHRIAYEVVKGRIPEGKTLDHLCRNRLCVNPDHLEPVTNRENLIRGNGFAGQNIRKTHCPNGHRLEEGNLVRSQLKLGRRTCVICNRERQRLWRRNHLKQRIEYQRAYRARMKKTVRKP